MVLGIRKAPSCLVPASARPSKAPRRQHGASPSLAAWPSSCSAPPSSCGRGVGKAVATAKKHTAGKAACHRGVGKAASGRGVGADVAEQQALQAAVHQATQVMLDRVEVELSLSNGFVSFTALNLQRWRQAFLLGRQGDDSKLVTLRRHARRALAIWRLDSDAAVGELEGVAAKLTQDHRSRIDSGKVADGREIWVLALHPNFGRSISAKVQDFIRIYMAALDGTCGVERDLGALTRVPRLILGRWTWLLENFRLR